MLLDPTLTTQPPLVTKRQAEALAQHHFGKGLEAHELSGERDRNFRMVAPDGDQFLLKIANPAEAAEIVHLQTDLLNHIRSRAPDLPVPHPVATLDGAYHASIVLDDGRSSILRMLTFLPGLPLVQSPRTTIQRQALGHCLARLDKALERYFHPAAKHDLLWNVSAAHRLKGMLENISEPSRRRLIQRFMDEYEANTLPHLETLRAQVIHNDFNLGNVLVDPDRTDEVTAIIDFGDVMYGPLVGEIATAAAYQLSNADDPLLNAGEMIGAYNEILPLQPAEQAVLLDLVVARLVITVLITEWRAARYPENRNYIMRNNGLAWAGLEHIDGFSRDEASRQLLQFCLTGDDQ